MSTCTHRRRSSRSGGYCPGHIVPGSPVDLCMKHLREAYEYFCDLLDIVRQKGNAAAQQQARRLRGDLEPLPATNTGPVVFYARHGVHIKIGHTTNLTSRLRTMGGADLLAVEPGDTALRRRRTHQFSAYLTRGRSTFNAGPELLAHIDTLRANLTKIH